jgi:hypothetical protein
MTSCTSTGKIPYRYLSKEQCLSSTVPEHNSLNATEFRSAVLAIFRSLVPETDFLGEKLTVS